MKQEIIDLYDEFTHRGLDRRVFMSRLAELAGGTAAATSALMLLRADYAKAAIVPQDDQRITTERVSIPRDGYELKGYLVRPAGNSDQLPSVIVVHENRGLNPHTEDVTRRMATEGLMALGVDFLSSMGGTPADEDQAREMIGKLDPKAVVADAEAAMSWLTGRPDSNGKVGIVGFCWGGGVVGNVAAAVPELDAGVVYYGRTPDLAAVPQIQAPLLLHYAGLDERINATVPAFEEALKANGKVYAKYIYEGANHAFNNDTSEARYDPTAAQEAWGRTVAFFKQHLA